MAARKKVITAKLVRGRVYVYENVHYMRSVATVVSADLADQLGELFEVVKDSDGDEFEKSIFAIDYNAKLPSAKRSNVPKRKRLKARFDDDDDDNFKPRVRPKRRRV